MVSENSDDTLPLQVLSSAAGFYIGTFDPQQGPVSRASVEYWPTHDRAQTAFDNGTWTAREAS